MPSGITLNKIEDLKRSMLNCNVFSVYDYDCLSMQELLCTFFEKINQCVDVTNKTVVLVDWLVSQGLKEEVAKKLEVWFADGTLANIINEVIFKELNNKVLLNTRAITNLENNFTEYKNTNDARVNKIRHELDSVFVFSDSFFTLQQAHDEVVRRGGGTLVINKDYDLERPFIWDCSKVIIDGHGHKLESTGNEPVINVVSSETKGKPYYQAQISFSNLRLKGNKKSSALYLNSNDPNKAISHVTFRNVSIENTTRAIHVGNSVYLLKFVDCDIFNNENIITVSSTVTDTGENIQFRGSALYNNTGGIVIENGNCDIFIDNCSIDYNVHKSIVETVGRVFISNSHIEHGNHQFNDGVVPFVVKGDAGFLSIDNCFILFDQNHQTRLANIFFTERDMCKINLTNSWLFGLKTTSRWLCGGTGKLYTKGNQMNIVPVNDLRISPSLTQSAIGTMTASKLYDIFITWDADNSTIGKTSGTNLEISYVSNITYKHGKSIHVNKKTGGGSNSAFAHIVPIDRMSINNLELMVKKTTGSGTCNFTMGYCRGFGDDLIKEQRALITKNYGTGETEWESIEWYLKDAPSWATHMYVDCNMDNANQVQLYIGEISANSF